MHQKRSTRPSLAVLAAQVIVPSEMPPFGDILFEDGNTGSGELTARFHEMTDEESDGAKVGAIYEKLRALSPAAVALVRELDKLNTERGIKHADAAFAIGVEVGKRLAGGAR